MFIRAQSGAPVGASYTYSASYLEEIGPYPDQSNTGITLTTSGAGDPALDRPAYRDFTTIVDIRAEKQVTIGKYGVLHFYFDVFNTFNTNTVTNFSTSVGRNWMRINDIIPPRVIRLGGAWDF
jgi:hypothetical protein